MPRGGQGLSQGIEHHRAPAGRGGKSVAIERGAPGKGECAHTGKDAHPEQYQRDHHLDEGKSVS